MSRKCHIEDASKQRKGRRHVHQEPESPAGRTSLGVAMLASKPACDPESAFNSIPRVESGFNTPASSIPPSHWGVNGAVRF